MNTLEIFKGKRLIEELNVFTKSKGKVRLDCKIEEEWKQKYSETSACGIPIKLNIKRVVGVSITERESLESTISSKFGLKDVWEISSALKSSIGYELRYDETVEEAKGIEALTPQCGRLTVKVFQLHRLYTFTYKDDRFWRRKNTVHAMVEKLNDWWNYPDTLDPAPECKCKIKSEGGIKNFLGIAFKNFGIHVECRQTTEALVIPSLGLSFPGKRLEDLYGKSVTINRESLPSHMLFLSGEPSYRLTGVVVEYREAPTETHVLGSEKRAISLVRVIGLSILAGVGFVLIRLARRPVREKLGDAEGSTRRESTDRLKSTKGVGGSEERSDSDRGGPAAHA